MRKQTWKENIFLNFRPPNIGWREGKHYAIVKEKIRKTIFVILMKR